PDKEEYYFTGWSTDSKATVGSYRFGDVIPADISLGSDDEITLYAIYGTDLSVFPDLVDVVEIGDYVDYPVEYENVVTHTSIDQTTSLICTSKLNGWRVLNKNEETGEISLISAGIPLSLVKTFDGTTTNEIVEKMSSTTEFLNINFTTNQADCCFKENGFNRYGYQNEGLINAFTNKYTKINSGIPEVRSMTKDDVDNVYQYFGGQGITAIDTSVNDKNFKDMIVTPSITSDYGSFNWLATIDEEKYLWTIRGNFGIVGSGYNAILGVRPVVTLKPNIKALGTNLDGTWKMEMETGIVAAMPTVDGIQMYDYSKAIQTLQLKNYNSNTMTITGNTATEVGTYTAIVSLKDTTKYSWVDGSKEPIEITWEVVEPTVDNMIKAGKLNVGDYVAYTPDTATYSTVAANTGGTSQKLTTETAEWRILDINEEEGKVILTTYGTVHTGEIYLSGDKGYVKGPTELHNIANALYSNKELGIEAKSITFDIIEDAFELTNLAEIDEHGNYGKKYAIYNTTSTLSGKIDGYTKRGHTNTFYSNWTVPKFYSWDDENGEMVTATTTSGYKKPTSSTPVKITINYCHTENLNSISLTVNEIFKDTSRGYIASHAIHDLTSSDSTESKVRFVLPSINLNRLGAVMLIDSDGIPCAQQRGLYPTITLDSYIKMPGKDENGAWILEYHENDVLK
ncbi:MAG: hypothetical protein IJX34_05185, partial [Clostridia bacterium]|nr:hypothetical protein [Clostridia bacterium]